MCQFLLMGWGATVLVAVFVLYVRDPYASGARPSRMDALMPKLKSKLRGICDRLCTRGLCLSPCANPA